MSVRSLSPQIYASSQIFRFSSSFHWNINQQTDALGWKINKSGFGEDPIDHFTIVNTFLHYSLSAAYISGRFTDQSADQLWRPSSHFTLVNFDYVCNKFSMRKNFMCSKFFKNLFAHTHKHIHSQSNQVSQSPDHFSLLFIAWPYLAIEKSKILCANYFFLRFYTFKMNLF